jgi:putative ABC transport system permease protein
LADNDASGSTPVALISQSLAHQFFRDEDPIGKHISLELTDKYFEIPSTPRMIVGIVGDVKMGPLDSDISTSLVYLPFEQLPGGDMSLVVRTSNNPADVVSSVTAAIRALDPSLAPMDVSTMDEVIASSLAQRRFNMLLLAAFAGLALVLAAVGIYSVLSYAVRRRVREIGIRMALGAQIRDVVGMVVMDGMTPAVIGVAIGFAGALALGRVLASVIYGVSARDLLTFATVSVLLLAVALLASVLPAYRAAQVQPVTILRDE